LHDAYLIHTPLTHASHLAVYVLPLTHASHLAVYVLGYWNTLLSLERVYIYREIHIYIERERDSSD
jgi:hypothetical protein